MKYSEINKIAKYVNKVYNKNNPSDLATQEFVTNKIAEVELNGGNSDTIDNYHIVVCTQSEYNALLTKDASTIYIIKG